MCKYLVTSQKKKIRKEEKIKKNKKQKTNKKIKKTKNKKRFSSFLPADLPIFLRFCTVKENNLKLKKNEKKLDNNEH